MKSWIRDTLGGLLWGLGITAPRGPERFTIVMFHRVLPAAVRDDYPLPGIAVTPEELRWFLGFFRQHFVCGSLQEMAARWLADQHQSGPPLLAVTFDDGQLDNYTHALPVLREAQVQASFFPALAHVESGQALWHDRLGGAIQRMLRADEAASRAALADMGVRLPRGSLRTAVEFAVEDAKRLEPDFRLDRVEQIEGLAPRAEPEWAGMMSWDQLRALVAEGHEVGSHSLSHAFLPQCSDEELAAEVGESRTRLRDQLGIECESFCYPNGDSDARTARAVAAAGYRYGVTTRWGANARSVDLYRLNRCNMNFEQTCDRRGELSAARLAWRISGLQPGLG